MKVAIVLGFYLNDDGTPRERLVERLNITKDMVKELNPDKIIVSGGIANQNAGVSEASVMGNWLIEHGISKDKVILEDKSMSTKENALYSMPIALSYNPNLIILVSTMDHYVSQPYNTIKYFNDNLENQKINFIVYTKTKTE